MTALEQLRRADPLDPAEVRAWSGSLPDLVGPAPVRDRRRALPFVVAGLVVASTGTVGVAVATGLLGGPAPDPIKAHLAELDRGIPADLKFGADLSHARTVAATHSGALYLADLRDGGYCVELGSPLDQPRGASCVPEARLTSLPLDVLAPLPDASGPLLVGGRANDDRITRVTVRYPSGRTADVPFGLDRSWLVEVPAAEQSTVLSEGLVIAGLSDTGEPVTTVDVPALRDDDPTGTRHDGDVPLVLTTTSDGNDFTLVLGVQGRVNLVDVRLEIVFPDGTRQSVPVAADGSFSVSLTPDRQDDFATKAGELIASRNGQVIASRPLASVAWWRGHHG